MSNELLLKSVLELIAIFICCCALCNEKKLAKIEHKAFRIVKCAVLAFVSVARKEYAAKQNNVVKLVAESEKPHAVKHEKCDDIRIA